MKEKQMNSNMFRDMYEEMGVSIDGLGCVMLDLLPPTGEDELRKSIESSLYVTDHPDRYWINGWIFNKPHITLLYGLLESAKKNKKHVERVLDGWNVDSVMIDHVSFFDSPYEDEEYWCIVAHVVKTEELLEGRGRVELLPHINTFVGYKPHVTVCYIKKSVGESHRDLIISMVDEFLTDAVLEIEQINFGK